MKYFLHHLCIAFIIYAELSYGKPSKPRQLANISFAIPALNLLGGGGLYTNTLGTGSSSAGGGGGNIFRQATVTRTIVRTVSTVGQGVPRTCTAPLPAALPACPGRRRRSADGNENGSAIEPSLIVVMGTTSITDQIAVSQLLGLDKQSSHANFSTDEVTANAEEDLTTKLYPSYEVPDSLLDVSGVTEGIISNANIETQKLDGGNSLPVVESAGADSDGRAGFNFAGTMTITSTISITAVTSSFISGPASVTLTVSYAGCSATSFPVTGTPC